MALFGRNGVFGRIVNDSVELSRAVSGSKGDGTSPSMKEVLKTAGAQDGFRILVMTRVREACREYHVPGANHLLRFASTALYGIEIGSDVELGPGVNFAHTLGTVIGGTAKVGARVKFLGNNTVGTAKDNGYPTIEDDVIVGAGARILGPIRVGRGATIGANAVVLEDVAPGSVMVGVPAKAKGKGKD